METSSKCCNICHYPLKTHRNERFLGEGHALPYDVVRVMMVVVLRVLRLRVSRIAAHNIDAMVIGIGEVVVTIAIAEHIYKANGMEFAGVDVKGDNHGGVHDNVEQNACPNEIDLEMNQMHLNLSL